MDNVKLKMVVVGGGQQDFSLSLIAKLSMKCQVLNFLDLMYFRLSNDRFNQGFK